MSYYLALLYFSFSVLLRKIHACTIDIEAWKQYITKDLINQYLFYHAISDIEQQLRADKVATTLYKYWLIRSIVILYLY
jgi:hypothetical protein